MIKILQLLAICPWLQPNVNAWVAALNDAMDAADVNTRARAAMFLAQAAHESAGFRELTENMNYSAAQLVRTWPTRFYHAGQTASKISGPVSRMRVAEEYERQPEKIANFVYGGRGGNGPEETGDGWKFRARGCGITFRENYAAVSLVLFKDESVLLEDPDLLARGEVVPAFSFAWYWKANDLNRFADVGDLDSCSDVINMGRVTAAVGDAIGYADRKRLFERFSEVLGVD